MKTYLLSTIALFSAAASAFGSGYTGPDGGEYGTAENWNPAWVPGSTGAEDSAEILNKSVVSNTTATTTGAAGRLMIGRNGSGSLTIQSGTLTFGGDSYGLANYVGVSYAGVGTVNNSLILDGGNFVSTSGALYLAANGNGTGTKNGTVTVNSGSALTLLSSTAGNLCIGNNNSYGPANATLNVNGGTVSVAGTMYAGHNDNSHANINIASGSHVTFAKSDINRDPGATTTIGLTVDAATWNAVDFGALTIANKADVTINVNFVGNVQDYYDRMEAGTDIALWNSTGAADFIGVSLAVDFTGVNGLDGVVDLSTGRFMVTNATPIPEPSTYALLGAGFALGAAVILRRRKTK